MEFFEYFGLGEQGKRDNVLLDRYPQEMGVASSDLSFGRYGGQVVNGRVRMIMTDEHPGIVLTDFISTTTSYLIVSNDAKEVIERECSNEIEYVNLDIINHKGKLHSGTYWIVNPIGTKDVLDIDKCKPFWKNDKVTLLGVIKRFYDKRKFESVPHLFRVYGSPQDILIRLYVPTIHENKCVIRTSQATLL